VRALHFPGLHSDAATWLLRERQVKAAGIDTASIDYEQSAIFETLVALLTQSVPVFKNLSDLRDLNVGRQALRQRHRDIAFDEIVRLYSQHGSVQARASAVRCHSLPVTSIGEDLAPEQCFA
jgi:hypothetical protein